MLKQRLITAILLLALLLPAIFYPAPGAFAAVAIVLISAAAWEWARLNNCGAKAALLSGAVCAAMCLASWSVGLLLVKMSLFWIGVGGVWVLLSAWLLRVGVPGWQSAHRGLRLCGGIFALWAAWLAVAQARVIGINFLFSVLVLVWVADIFAYFAGRAFGNKLFARKLAPSISPGKTWEGALGGMIGVVLLSLVWHWVETKSMSHQDSLYSRLAAIGPMFSVLAVIFLSVMSVVGDLVESLFKRSAGVKDSSGLLPGHGGVLDRIDALLPVLPLAMMLSTP
jgi:phosphatidate cytidylyltransferase